VSRLAASFGDSVCHELSQDHVQAFLARYKLVVCMNLFVLFFLCICSGFFTSSSSNSGMGNNKGLDGVSKPYPSYMEYQTGTTTTRSSSSLPAAAGGRLRGLSRRDKGDTSQKASASLVPLSSSWASSTHVPQRPPPRFVRGTLPQSEDKPVVAATSDGAATATAETASKPSKSATTSKTGASNGLSKKRALLSSLASSQEADMLVTSAAEALEETAPAPASMAAADAFKGPVDAGLMPTYAEKGGALVQCTFSEAVDGEDAMLTIHDDLVLDVEGASDQNVRAPSTEAEKEEEAAVPMTAFEEAGGIHVDHSVSSLCPLTPPSAEAQGEPAIEVEGAGVEEAGVLLNPDVVDAGREELAALAMEAAEKERVDEPNQQMEEEMVAMPLLQVRLHPLEYIPPFAREDVFC